MTFCLVLVWSSAFCGCYHLVAVMQLGKMKERFMASKHGFTVSGARMRISLVSVWMWSAAS